VISAAQAAISGAADSNGASAASIPTRGTSDSSLPYGRFYTHAFAQPATYIRFSSTVEDSIAGSAYDMVAEDVEFLARLNVTLSKAPISVSGLAGQEAQLSGCDADQFEAVMAALEAAARASAPFASAVQADGAAAIPVVSLAEAGATLDEELGEAGATRALAAPIYAHWRARRARAGNQPLRPTLKVRVLEQGDAAEDADAYVCFRRREVRAARKTRGRDAQSVEKLKRLRKELEEARALVGLVAQRERARREGLAVDRALFEQRAALRGLKRSLPEQYRAGDEDLLVNQKPRKPRPLDPASLSRANAASSAVAQLTANGTRLLGSATMRPDGSSIAAGGIVSSSRDGVRISSGPELQMLADWLAAKENAQMVEIKGKIAQHEQWNRGYVDRTRFPLTLPLGGEEGLLAGIGERVGFRRARAEYLPTPPASIGSAESEESEKIDVGGENEREQKVEKEGSEKNDSPKDEDQGRDKQGENESQTREGSESATTSRTPSRPRNSSRSTPASLPNSTSHTLISANDKAVAGNAAVSVRYALPSQLSPPPDPVSGQRYSAPSFRRRVGRGGRLMIDRRGFSTPSSVKEYVDPMILDRFSYDRDSDDDEDSQNVMDVSEHSSPRGDKDGNSLRATTSGDRASNANGAHGAGAHAGGGGGSFQTYMVDPFGVKSMLLRAQMSLGWSSTGREQQQLQAEKARRERALAAQQQGQPHSTAPAVVVVSSTRT